MPGILEGEGAVSLERRQTGEQLTRLVVCAVIAVAVVYAAEKLCEGKSYPLWETYGSVLMENKVQTIAVLTAVLYGLSLALLPEKRLDKDVQEEDFTPC